MSEQTELPTESMTVEAFCAWVDAAPRPRCELEEGRVVAMAPERAIHGEAKAAAWLALRNAIRAAGVDYRAYLDSLAVAVGPSTAYQPDVLVNCGPRPAPAALVAPNPVIVVEVSSPSTSRVDAVAKFLDYMRLDSIRHYLLIDAVKRIVVHHRKEADGRIMTMILPTGPLTLDPPGITVQVESLFED
jgi:Uma2 family endonuclease